MSYALSGAAVAPSLEGSPRTGYLRRLVLVVLALAFAITLLAIAPPAEMHAGQGRTEAAQIVASARDKIGAPWVWAATGPKAFDCSGLVFRVFKENGLEARIGGRKGAKGYYNWARQRGLLFKKNPRVGDLVIWGKGSHIGIYIGNGNAISTLTSGVKVHGVFRVTTPFTAYVKVNLSR